MMIPGDEAAQRLLGFAEELEARGTRWRLWRSSRPPELPAHRRVTGEAPRFQELPRRPARPRVDDGIYITRALPKRSVSSATEGLARRQPAAHKKSRSQGMKRLKWVGEPAPSCQGQCNGM